MRGADSTKRFCSKKSQSSLGAAPVSELVNIEIDDLPDVVLVEILCRLPCYNFVSKCKCVSKRWCNVMSGSYFIGRFLCLQSDRETPIIRTLIAARGQEFLNRMSSSSKPLALLFERLMSVHHLDKEPVVLATYNDLVLCCTHLGFYTNEYYICNPCTIQWIPVPPPPRAYKYTPVGFMCDLPYYNCTKDDQGASVIQVNSECRCRIVRLILPHKKSVTKLKVQIFTSDTGEWITSSILIPSGFICASVPIERSFTYNGMLYFVGDEPGDQNFLLELDPFRINNSIIDHYRFIRFDDPEESFVLQYFGEYRGCLHLCDYHHHTCTLFVLELKEEELCGGAGQLSLEGMKDYSLDLKMVPGYDELQLLFLDPNNEDVIFLHIGNDIVRYNIRTREWSMLAENIPYDYQYPIVLPWWPTPVPRLLQHAQLR